MAIYIFDADNVVLSETKIVKTSGIITGRAGDAFRLHLSSMTENVDGEVKKIEFRSDASTMNGIDLSVPPPEAPRPATP